MNKYQRLVVVAALINALVMLLFPPFASQPLVKGVLPGFDGFFPLFSQLGSKPVFTELLTLQLMFVGINTLIAWLVLQDKDPRGANPEFRFAQAIGGFVAVNLAVIVVFPPFEPYQSLLRYDTGGFDSFYFIFGSRSRRTIYWPLLYLECMVVVIDALVLFLLFSAAHRGDNALRRDLVQLAAALPDDAVARIAEEIRHQINAPPPQAVAALGRGADRRRARPTRVSKERRSGKDRREQNAREAGGGS